MGGKRERGRGRGRRGGMTEGKGMPALVQRARVKNKDYEHAHFNLHWT